jgi:hypothetical protein
MTTTLERSVLAAAALGLGLAGTAHAQLAPRPVPDPQPTPEAAPAETSVECPEFVRGAELTVTNVDRGVAFEITTPRAESVADLRQLLRDLAQVVEAHADSATADAEALELPPVDIAVSDIPSGARIVVHTEGTNEISQVREHAREVDRFWQSSACINGGAG